MKKKTQKKQSFNKDVALAVKNNDEKLVTVCANCLKASCVSGWFQCEENFESGTKEMKIKDLKKLNLEHSRYWSGRVGEKFTVSK